ncbi:hypothetical protein DQ04_02221010 [Trypanosoma grayi]|uniref:hypothetical protein n=1 Tax=Trypanosoma grayi TaxID=71804 RepID=UPI0004F45052|nr:hypothetical protein DQ04_02221010 [Trypanosoma grayi]KEG11839.1 hypothetical protein DQ04_02221010 [Trypanosoma grayi]
MSVLPNGSTEILVGVGSDDCNNTKELNDDSSSTSDESPCDDSVVTLNEVYAMTKEVQQREEELRRCHETRHAAGAKEMLRRREALRERIAFVRHQLPSAREELREAEWEQKRQQGCEARASSVRIEPENPLAEGDDVGMRVKRLRAVLPWSTRMWRSFYNTTRFLLISVSYTPYADLNDPNSRREYYKEEVYE